MRVRDYLKAVRKEQGELQNLIDVRDTKNASLQPSGIRYDKDKVQTSPKNKMEEIAAEVLELDKYIEKQIHTLTARQYEALRMIDTLDDPDERQVLRRYYLELMPKKVNGVMVSKKATWEDVAEKTHWSRSQVFLIHDRAILKLEEHYGDI